MAILINQSTFAIVITILVTGLVNVSVVLSTQCTEFSCSSGECISVMKKCDGVIDCVDGSDETTDTCREHKCDDSKFRCDYGGCINGTEKCNGVSDCVDRSDETTVSCKGHKCDNSTFQCDYGGCIDKTKKCNGASDCVDRSDEDILKCKNTNCDQGQFKCKYGGCIDQKFQCDGQYDCLDGSDEVKESCLQYKINGCDRNDTNDSSIGKCQKNRNSTKTNGIEELQPQYSIVFLCIYLFAYFSNF